MKPNDSKLLWSYGLLLRCRGQKLNDGATILQGGDTKKKKKKRRRRRKNNDDNTKQNDELNSKGLEFLIKSIELNSHQPNTEHLLHIAKLLKTESDYEHKMLFQYSTNKGVKEKVFISERFFFLFLLLYFRLN